jgi:ABC-2 type transport system ATP-binding protein
MNQVTKLYGSHIGVQNINLDLPEGEVVGLIGLNGSGKTTTLKLMSGLLKPSSGTVTLNAKGKSSSPRKNRGSLAFHSELDTLYPWLDPSNAIIFMQGLYPDFNITKYQQLLQTLEVPHSTCSNMSKGQKSRFKLSLTLARDAHLFLLDEPLSGIDAISRKKIMATLAQKDNHKTTLVISTHEIEIAQELFDRIIIVNKGTIVLNDSAANLDLANKDIIDLFEGAIQ